MSETMQQRIENADTREEMKERIEESIEDKDIIIFMKGNKHMPQCGYSRKAVQTIAHYEEDFETVNVLNDPRIREVLSEITDWPTIPQVFVDGEFLGGSDTVYEMHEEGELEEKTKAI